MKLGILILIILIFNLSLIYANRIPDECIASSSNDKNNLDLNDGPKVVLQKYLKENNKEEALMFFYEENMDEFGALKLILNYKEVGDDVYSFKAKDKVECDKDDCEEYFVKKEISDKCRRFNLEIRLMPSEEGIKKEVKELKIYEGCEDITKEEASLCSNELIIRGLGRIYYFFKYINYKLNLGSEPVAFTPDLSICKKINIVVAGQGFLSDSEKENFRELANKAIINGFFKNDVMISNAFRFNFYLLDPGKDFNCRSSCQGIQRALCCDYSKITKEISKCPNDFIYVIVNSDDDAGSTSGVISASTSGAFDEGVVEHELIGHGVGDLRDEYVDDDYFKRIDVRAERNCYGDNSCRDWCENNKCIEGTSCIKGCEMSTWFRPHLSSFMRVSGEEIGRYNEKLICERIKKITKVVSGYCEEIT